MFGAFSLFQSFSLEEIEMVRKMVMESWNGNDNGEGDGT
jgi:hypothetical protein